MNNPFDNNIFDVFEEMFRNATNLGPVINKPLSPDTFLSTYLKLSANMDQKTADVLVYMIKNMDKDNIFHGNYDLLTSKLEISRPKLAQIMTNLQATKYIERASNGFFKISNNQHEEDKNNQHTHQDLNEQQVKTGQVTYYKDESGKYHYDVYLMYNQYKIPPEGDYPFGDFLR